MVEAFVKFIFVYLWLNFINKFYIRMNNNIYEKSLLLEDLFKLNITF